MGLWLDQRSHEKVKRSIPARPAILEAWQLGCVALQQFVAWQLGEVNNCRAGNPRTCNHHWTKHQLTNTLHHSKGLDRRSGSNHFERSGSEVWIVCGTGTWSKPWWHSIIQQQNNTRQSSWQIISWIPRKTGSTLIFQNKYWSWEEKPVKTVKNKMMIMVKKQDPLQQHIWPNDVKMFGQQTDCCKGVCLIQFSGSGPILNPLPQKATLVTMVGYACFFKIPLKYTNLNQKSH